MASIPSTTNTQIAGVPRLVWGPMNSTDANGDGYKLLGQNGLTASVHVIGTFNTGTLTMKVSNTNNNYVTLKDTQGLDVAFTAVGYAEFSTSAAYIRPELTGAGSDSVTVVVVLRG
jgi:hypothetical protein